MPRIQMQLSRIAVLSFKEFKILKYGDPNIRITNGYLVGVAFNSIKDKAEQIDWISVDNTSIVGVTKDADKTYQKTFTTLNIETTIHEDIKELQKYLIQENGSRIYFSYVIKLIMLAAILNISDDYELPIK
ncbi:hypothetical protein [Brochothrix thermosphacta]|uniref:hypothetical protein n=1 Tax=Brochothrix thermosphacta TaxID=2756 RepID=UPI00083FA279|nr:hypothetical protein [Brochothrix thermosphacta]ODJ72290.1 hypothetical protein BFR43_01005 [Brochothrix thermosphacta]